ncbi:hypothetical protein [Apilactobacillus timberlakei]|uniref:hypothetical protein n=1 Tax=Apilactobacillus timberlakei TaxID=2008380 RepID=UPI00112E643E|nr:hypothetical protein [Apilactobacillus timberlakei]TPR12246.1 hypothetical protein DYZ97_07130 [Apilactobacillus timberlakei]
MKNELQNLHKEYQSNFQKELDSKFNIIVNKHKLDTESKKQLINSSDKLKNNFNKHLKEVEESSNGITSYLLNVKKSNENISKYELKLLSFNYLLDHSKSLFISRILLELMKKSL